ncbi:MAG: CHAD domain-containing protein [Solirubrobacterales bacterium]
MIPTYRLRADEPVADGLRRVATGRAESAIQHLRGKVDEEPAVAVHETRKDLKKLRSVLRLVRGPLGDGTYARENSRYGEAARVLSGPRDAEVKLETIAALQERFGDSFPGDGLAVLIRALEDERRALSEGMSLDDGAGPAATAALQIEAGRDAIADWSLDGEDFELIAAGLKRSYRRGRNRFADTGEDPSAENVHEWRKRVKDLWYHLRLVRDARPGKLGRAADKAHDLSDLLGDHHDLAVLREDAESRTRLLSDEDLGGLGELVAQRQSELLASATSLAEGLYAEPPKKFIARIERHWRKWR